MNRIRKIAKEIILADKTWNKEEWNKYKKDHHGTKIQPKFNQESTNIYSKQKEKNQLVLGKDGVVNFMIDNLFSEGGMQSEAEESGKLFKGVRKKLKDKGFDIPKDLNKAKTYMHTKSGTELERMFSVIGDEAHGKGAVKAEFKGGKFKLDGKFADDIYDTYGD